MQPLTKKISSIENAIKMVFKFNTITFNDRENWDEFIQITFVSDDNKYLSLSSILYEEEINIELNDQIKYLQFFKSNFNFYIEEKLILKIREINKGTIQDTLFEIESTTNYDVEYLLKALDVLSEYVEE
ncbi:hypothetical protein ACUN24_05595 [Pedobacter sp. WC2501]|uniref:hypothetical protein n=1 Tax=Pedobacter sp. WC2501 TaxID=3461400 RepID=UPI0040462C64